MENMNTFYLKIITFLFIFYGLPNSCMEYPKKTPENEISLIFTDQKGDQHTYTLTIENARKSKMLADMLDAFEIKPESIPLESLELYLLIKPFLLYDEFDLKRYSLKELQKLIEAVHYYDIIDSESLLTEIYRVFAQKIDSIEKIKEVVSYYIYPEISPYIAHYILEQHKILQHVCKNAFGKGKKRKLYEIKNSKYRIGFIPSQYSMNKKGDIAFVIQKPDEQAHVYIYTVDDNKLIDISLETFFETNVIGNVIISHISCAISPDGKSVVCFGIPLQSHTYTLNILDVETGQKKIFQTNLNIPIIGIVFSPDGNSILIGSQNNIDQYDAETGASLGKITTFSDQNKYISGLQFDQFKNNYLLIKYILENRRRSALYDYNVKTWIDENEIPLYKNEPFDFNDIKAFIDQKAQEKIIGINQIQQESAEQIGKPLLLSENIINYQFFVRLDFIKNQLYDESFILSDVVPNDVFNLIKDFNKPFISKKTSYQDALYLLAAKFNDWDNIDSIDQLFIGVTVKENIQQIARIKSRPDTSFEQIPMIVAGAAPSSNGSSSSSSGEELSSAPQPPQDWRTRLSEGATSAKRKMMEFYAKYSNRIKYGLGVAALGFGAWLYQKYYAKPDLSSFLGN